MYSVLVLPQVQSQRDLSTREGKPSAPIASIHVYSKTIMELTIYIGGIWGGQTGGTTTNTIRPENFASQMSRPLPRIAKLNKDMKQLGQEVKK
jgi:hypothetical protein